MNEEVSKAKARLIRCACLYTCAEDMMKKIGEKKSFKDFGEGMVEETLTDLKDASRSYFDAVCKNLVE